MKNNANGSKKGLFAVIVIALLIVVCFALRSMKDGMQHSETTLVEKAETESVNPEIHESEAAIPGTDSSPGEVSEHAESEVVDTDISKKETMTQTSQQKLLDFCADEELNAWFDSLEEKTPVKMTYIIYGEAPIYMVFTDRDLIIRTAEALKTVEIGGLSNENPDYVADAGGGGYFFEMDDDSAISFIFQMGCFRWKNGEWHDVVNYGQLRQVSEELTRIGNPQYQHIYADDDGFYTKVLEIYKTDWKEEDGLGGGLFIYTGEPDDLPYIEICRCAATDTEPEAFLLGELDTYMRERIEESGADLLDVGKVETYSTSRKSLPSVLYTAQLPDDRGGGKICYLNLAFTDEDDLLGDSCIIRICAVYRETENTEKIMKALNAAVDGFNFNYKAYEKKDVQPDNYLVDFINDDRIRAWFEGVDENKPDSLIYMTSSWELISEPEKIMQILNALQTVKIGEENNSHRGASGRRCYDFTYNDSGETISFDFFGNVFSWKNKTYDVLDWGELK